MRRPTCRKSGGRAEYRLSLYHNNAFSGLLHVSTRQSTPDADSGHGPAKVLDCNTTKRRADDLHNLVMSSDERSYIDCTKLIEWDPTRGQLLFLTFLTVLAMLSQFESDIVSERSATSSCNTTKETKP